MRYSINNWIESHKRICLLCVVILLIGVLFVCYRYCKSLEESRITPPVTVKIEDVTEDDFPYHYIDEKDTDETGSEAELINLDENDGEVCEIRSGGTYRLTGALTGRLFIKCKNEVVHLLLDNVSIEAIDGPAVIIEDAAKVIITALPGTDNTIADSGSYQEMGLYESAIESKSNITFNGSGTLNVYGLYKDAVRTNDVFKMIDGTLNIQCKKTAIHATDGMHIAGGSLNIESEKNAFKTTKDGAYLRGAIIVSGGNMSIIAGRYTFVSKAPIYVFNCSIFENSVARYDATSVRYVDEECFK